MTVQDEHIEVTTKTMGFVQAINSALDIALGSDPTVFALGEDIQEPGGGGFQGVRCPAHARLPLGPAAGSARAGPDGSYAAHRAR